MWFRFGALYEFSPVGLHWMHCELLANEKLHVCVVRFNPSWDHRFQRKYFRFFHISFEVVAFADRLLVNMGAYLSEPVLDKHSSDENSDCLSYGASSMQGWRVSQEVNFLLHKQYGVLSWIFYFIRMFKEILI